MKDGYYEAGDRAIGIEPDFGGFGILLLEAREGRQGYLVWWSLRILNKTNSRQKAIEAARLIAEELSLPLTTDLYTVFPTKEQGIINALSR